jgi:AraC-like DNA-binding protein
VARYASLLGCSEKSLSRATYAVAQMSAKTLLVDRLVLEAKRMLAHSSSPVGAIALDLGFDEATNFVKFFRRETGMTPGAFRERHARHPTRP